MIGIDFGTTNSAVAMADKLGQVSTARYPSGDNNSETFRSILFFAHPQKGMRRELSAYAGPEAIERYLHAEYFGRYASGMAVDIGETFLDNLEDRRFEVAGEPPEIVWNLEVYLDIAALGKSLNELAKW